MKMEATKILLVEDEQVLRIAIKKKLESKNFVVEEAKNGDEAIKKLSEVDFDYMLLDLIMPQKNGFDVLNFCKDARSKPKIIVMSNLNNESEIGKALELGASSFFVKANTSMSDILKQMQ